MRPDRHPAPLLAADVVGSGPRRVVLLHGFAHTRHSWRDIAGALVAADDGITCVTVDLPGHGDTALRPTFAELVSILSATCRDAVVVGYSMGARLAIAVACNDDADVRGIVSIGGTAGIRDDVEREQRLSDDARLADRIERIGTAAFLAEWNTKPLFAGYVPGNESLCDRMRNEPAGLAYALHTFGAGSQPSYWEKLAYLRIPFLAVSGARDVKFTSLANEMSEMVPGGQRRLVAGAGHVAHLEQPETTTQIIAEFLARSDVRRAIS